MKYSKQARALAWLGIILVVVLIIYFLVNAFVGVNFNGALFMVMAVPVIIWVIMFFAGFFRQEDSDDDSEDDK